jgi:hypothetical protein
LRARVFAALRAASERFRGPFVFAALRAAAERSVALRFLAAACACLESAFLETELLGSSLRRSTPALDLFAEIGSWRWPFL